MQNRFFYILCMYRTRIIFRNNQERAVHGGEREGGPKKLLFVNFGTMCASKRVGRVRISCWHCIQYTIYLSLSVHTQLIRTTRTLFDHIVVSHWRSMIVLFFGCKENLKKEFWEKKIALYVYKKHAFIKDKYLVLIF